MELSTKQSAASRFDDEGLAAALAGDADNERTGMESTADTPALPSARGMGYTKMEPKVENGREGGGVSAEQQFQCLCV